MSRMVTWVVSLWCLAGAAAAQQAVFTDRDAAGVSVALPVETATPYRVFVLDDPPRLVADVAGPVAAKAPDTVRGISVVRLGPIAPGWTRLAAVLERPLLPANVALVPRGDGVILTFDLVPVERATFAARAGAPPGLAHLGAAEQPPAADADVFTVVLDPGHGGIDPGAERGGLVEKDVALDMARRIATALDRAGVRAVMTRDADRFVSLAARTAFAHQVGGDVFVSIHADALPEGGAEGATIYTLSTRASDRASAELATRHNRADILAGLDLSAASDGVTHVLLDIARRETTPRSRTLAETLAAGMAEAGGPMNGTPLRSAGFSVLKSADIPSVLVEVGFLSSPRDARYLGDPVWRALQAEAVAGAILAWRDADARARNLVLQ